VILYKAMDVGEIKAVTVERQTEHFTVRMDGRKERTESTGYFGGYKYFSGFDDAHSWLCERLGSRVSSARKRLDAEARKLEIVIALTKESAC
jgi:hypothetical protein